MLTLNLKEIFDFVCALTWVHATSWDLSVKELFYDSSRNDLKNISKYHVILLQLLKTANLRKEPFKQ